MEKQALMNKNGSWQALRIWN